MNTVQNQNNLVSIIVPCYNVGKYLNKCIDSIIEQTYKNIEIILVDDGATDNTGEICDSYALKDSRVKVIHQNNRGLSAARNKGLENVKGMFLTFVDSDDWLARHAIEYYVYLQKKYNADIVCGKMCSLLDNGDSIKYITHKTIDVDRTATSEEAIKSIQQVGCCAVCKLYKTEVFRNIRFPVGVINEDEEVVLKIYHRYHRIVVGGRTTYYYRRRPDSITTSKFTLKKLDLYYNSVKNHKFVVENYPELSEYAYARHYRAAIYCSANLHVHRFGSEGKKHRKLIKKELRQDFFKMIRNRQLPVKFKIVGLICAII